MMRLIGGPWNNRIIHDVVGSGVQCMPIYSSFDRDNKPLPGCKYGYANYEPNEERTHSFWLSNEWVGIFEKIYKGPHFNMNDK